MRNRKFFLNNKTKNEEQMEAFILADNNSSDCINYINISIHGILQGLAPVEQLGAHLSHTQGLSGHPGSIPGWGASALHFAIKPNN